MASGAAAAATAVASCSHTSSTCHTTPRSRHTHARQMRLPQHAQRALGCCASPSGSHATLIPRTSGRGARGIARSGTGRRAAAGAIRAEQLQMADDYTAALQRCEADGDWVQVVELLTEVRVLKLELSDEAYESCVRTLCAGDQWKRAVDVLVGRATHKNSSDSKGDGSSGGSSGGESGGSVQLSDGMVETVFTALSQARAAEAAQAALDLLSAFERGTHAAYPAALNGAIRALARGGRHDDALRMLEELVADAELDPEWHTYNVVAKELIIAGRQDEGLDVLEWRDYL